MLYNYDKEYLLNTAYGLLVSRKNGISTNDFLAKVLKKCGLDFPGFGSGEYYDYKFNKAKLLEDLTKDLRFISISGKWYIKELYELNHYQIEERNIYLDSSRDNEKKPIIKNDLNLE